MASTSEVTIPTGSSEVTKLTNSSEVTIPTNSSEVTIPTSSTEVTISNDNEVTIPTGSSEVTKLTNSSEVTMPTNSSEVTMPAFSSEVTIPTDSTEVTVPNDSSEVTMPNDSEVTMPTDSSEVTMPNDSEVTMPTSSSEVTIPTGSTEVTIPTSSTEVTMPNDSEVTMPTSSSEVTIPTDCSCIESADCKDEDFPPLQLNHLPSELLIYIADFLDARTVIKSLLHVCRAFCELFSGDQYWKQRLYKRCSHRYPAVHVDDFDWKESCILREESYEHWTDPSGHLDHFTYNECLFAAVDTVHLMKEGSILAAGSRDRYLTILNLDKYNPERPESKKDMPVFSDCKAHKGWIWSLASDDNTLATGSWDTFIKLWDVGDGCREMGEFKCKSAILCLHMEPGLIVAGGYDKKTYFIDPRERKKTIKLLHRQPVLCVSADSNYIITGSEDKTIQVYDRRAASVYKTIQLGDHYALDMSYGDNQLWYGDKQGLLHLVDATHGKFDPIDTYDIGHTGKLTGVKHTRGAIFTSSSDYSIKVLEPTLNPPQISSLTQHTGDVAGISYQNGVLASAGCDISIGIWRPKRR